MDCVTTLASDLTSAPTGPGLDPIVSIPYAVLGIVVAIIVARVIRRRFMGHPWSAVLSEAGKFAILPLLLLLFALLVKRG